MIKNNMAPQIKYNNDAGILSIRVSRKRSIDSDVNNNVVVDYDENGEIVNIDIMKIGLDEFRKIKGIKAMKGAVSF